VCYFDSADSDTDDERVGTFPPKTVKADGEPDGKSSSAKISKNQPHNKSFTSAVSHRFADDRKLSGLLAEKQSMCCSRISGIGPQSDQRLIVGKEDHLNNQLCEKTVTVSSCLPDSGMTSSKKFNSHQEQATDLTVRFRSEGSVTPENVNNVRSTDRFSPSVQLDADILSRTKRESVMSPVRNDRSSVASSTALMRERFWSSHSASNTPHSPTLPPFSNATASSYHLTQRSCTPPHLRHFRQQQHVMRLQAAMSHALNLHHGYIPPPVNHPYHHHFDPSSAAAAAAAAAAAGALNHHHHHHHSQFKDRLSPSDSGVSDGGTAGDRRKRSRVFIDPLTEIPRLERWFAEDTHPSAYMIEQFTDELNRSVYRQRFPTLEAKNVQLWFKNHRAKVKRQKLEVGSSMDASSLVEVFSVSNSF